MGAEHKHTPGPWVAHTFMVRAGKDVITQTGYSSSLAGNPSRSTEAAANARLIAAAPELDEAAAEAWKALAWIINYDSENGTLARAMALIEAARKKAATFDYEATRSVAKAEGS